jgi:serine/threonine protein kinase
MISQTRIGRYEVVSVLGAGGTVYKAVDPLTRRTVAIRTITLDRSKPECAEFEARFHHETSAGRLRHANIVAIHDVGVTDDFAYVAMEYVEGETLREMLDSGVVLPVETISSIVERVANALNYAHENHMVHRDIKPANILITPGRDVKIKDFGIAQIPTGLHPLHGPMLEIMGTPQYMAPEQLAGGNTDGRTDIFALGVVLYEMLTGVMPFDGDELGAIIDQVLKAEPAPPSMLNRRVPPAFDRIISRALAKRPRDRYQTASAFAWDVRNPDAAPPPGNARACRRQQARKGRPGKQAACGGSRHHFASAVSRSREGDCGPVLSRWEPDQGRKAFPAGGGTAAQATLACAADRDHRCVCGGFSGASATQ